MAIPKIIHYCWFGNNPKSEEIQKYINSWKTHMPDYEIIEWNESNFDVNKLKYILGILNSKVGRLLVKNHVVQLQQRQFRMLNQYVVNFPIPKIDKTDVITILVDEVLSLKKQLKDTKSIEEKIDKVVYSLFKFNNKEVEFIESL